jgi:hypothetical protein
MKFHVETIRDALTEYTPSMLMEMVYKAFVAEEEEPEDIAVIAQAVMTLEKLARARRGIEEVPPAEWKIS